MSKNEHIGFKGVRIVNRSKGAGVNPALTDVYDLETGEKLLNVYGITLDVSRGRCEVVVRVGVPFEYEGPARIEYVPEETGTRQSVNIAANIDADEIAEKAAQRVMEALNAITDQERAALRGLA